MRGVHIPHSLFDSLPAHRESPQTPSVTTDHASDTTTRHAATATHAVVFSTPPLHPSDASYNGYKKSTVFAQWQKQLQKQAYEAAFHWTAELDVSGWQDDVWAKILVYASKHIHLHVPSLPILLARNYALYAHHVHATGSATCKDPHQQPRNVHMLRQNLCQVVGLLALSSKGPVYTLPKVNPAKVDDAEVLVGTHVWLAPHTLRSDDATAVRLLSTVCWHLEAQRAYKAMYWLSVLVEYEKHQKKHFKQTVDMSARKPLVPHDGLQQVVVEGRYAHDWVWLLWYGLDEAARRYNRPHTCTKALRALGYLFASEYTTSKRTTRLPLVLHAMLLVRTDSVDWNKSVYPNDQAAQLIAAACANVDIMYRSLADKRSAAPPAPPAPPRITSDSSTAPATHHTHRCLSGVDPSHNHQTSPMIDWRDGGVEACATDTRTPSDARLSTAPTNKPTGQTNGSGKGKKKKTGLTTTLSADSTHKINMVDELDALFLGL